MIKRIVCLCIGEDLCREQTAEIAKRNHASKWFVEPVYAPLSEQLTYKGSILL